jgi:hypothetical protein
MALTGATTLLSAFSRSSRAVVMVYPVARASGTVFLGIAAAAYSRESRQDIFNILWAVVFGFATINILTLAARRMEPKRRGLSFGELLAVMVVVLSLFLLGWEMLNLFQIFPIKLRR